MGNSILQSVARSTDGLQLFESFESADFMQDQAWTLVNGVPTTTNTVAFIGSKSLLMDLTYPQISKTFSAFGFSVAYFFDNAAVVAGGFQPFVTWVDSVGVTHGLGVNPAISGTFYVVNKNGVQTATTIPRTSAWHRFSIVKIPTTVASSLYIDNVLVATQNTFPGATLLTIKVGVQVFAGAPAFGFFDYIQVCKDHFFSMNELAAGQTLTLLQSDLTTAIGTALPTAGLAQIDVKALDQPMSVYAKVSKPNSALPFFITPLSSASAGDNWNLNVFDLGRRVPSFRKARPAMRTDIEATSGVNQSLFYYSRDMISMTFTSLTDDQVQDLQRWWGSVKQGDIFSAAIDSDNLFFGLITVDTGPAAASFTVGSAAGANKKSKLMLTRLNGQTFEVAEALSIAGAVITTKTKLFENYPVGSQVRDSYYWPFVIATDTTFEPQLINPKLRLWNCTVSFKEAL